MTSALIKGNKHNSNAWSLFNPTNQSSFNKKTKYEYWMPEKFHGLRGKVMEKMLKVLTVY